MPQITITIDDESLWLLDKHCEREAITARNRRSVKIQQLIHDDLKKLKIADRPVYPGKEGQE